MRAGRFLAFSHEQGNAISDDCIAPVADVSPIDVDGTCIIVRLAQVMRPRRRIADLSPKSRVSLSIPRVPGRRRWKGLFVPAGTPQSVIDRLRSATNEVIADKAFDAKLRATLSGKSYRSTPDEFAAQIKSEYQKYRALIRTLGIKIQ
jgi:hypothetical protein